VVSIDSATRELPGAGWLRDTCFDLAFLLGTPALAFGLGALLSIDRRFTLSVLLTNLLLLNYRRLATAERGPDRRPLRRRLPAAEPPLLLLAALVVLALAAAPWLPATVFFYWQWFQGARQGWSVVEAYRRRADRAADLGDHALLTAAFYMVPAWGILYRCAQAPESFIGLDIRLLPVAWPMVEVVGIAACAAAALWLVERALAWREGRLPLAHTLYTISHLVVFAVAYGLIDDIMVGWLVASIWRTAQSLSLAWLAPQRRGKGRDPNRHWPTTLTEHKQLGLYVVAAVAGAATAVLGEAALARLLPVAAILYLAADARECLLALSARRARRRPYIAPLQREPASAGSALPSS
jgi:hypothetical protein